MKVYKSVHVPAAPATTKTELHYIQCDLCERQTGWNNWSKENYEIDEVDVAASSGDNYPEGGSRESIILDICPDCFRNKLVPWFEAQGGKPRTEESSW